MGVWRQRLEQVFGGIDPGAVVVWLIFALLVTAASIAYLWY